MYYVSCLGVKNQANTRTPSHNVLMVEAYQVIHFENLESIREDVAKSLGLPVFGVASMDEAYILLESSQLPSGLRVAIFDGNIGWGSDDGECLVARFTTDFPALKRVGYSGNQIPGVDYMFDKRQGSMPLAQLVIKLLASSGCGGTIK